VLSIATPELTLSRLDQFNMDQLNHLIDLLLLDLKARCDVSTWLQQLGNP
jgi:hypothetical protein